MSKLSQCFKYTRPWPAFGRQGLVGLLFEYSYTRLACYGQGNTDQPWIQQGGLQNTESFQKQENNKILCDGKPLRTLGQGGTERPSRCSDVYSCFVITLDCRGSESHTGSKPYPSESRREQTWLLHDYYQRFVCAADQNNFFSSILFQKRWAQSLPACTARNTRITPSDMTLQC